MPRLRDLTRLGAVVTTMTPDTATTEAIRWHFEHLRLRNTRPATLTARRTVLRAVHRDLPSGLLAADRAEVEAWQTSLTVSSSSVQTYTDHVRGFYRWAHFYGVITEDPSDRLVTPRLPRRLPRPIPEDALMVAIRCADERMKVWLILAGWAGLRVGEIARLRREHIQDQEAPALVMVFDGKGGKDRIVPVGLRVCQAL